MFLVAIVVIVFLVWLLQRPFYFKGKKIKYLTPWPIIGNFGKFFTSGTIAFGKNLYNQFPEEKFYGCHAFFTPTLIIRDIDLIAEILIKDYQDFEDNGLGSNQEYDLTGGNLLFLMGQQWKEVRNKVSPFFTPSKVKSMVIPAVKVTMVKAEAKLDELARTGEPFDQGELLGQIVNDIITQATFGIESDVFEENSRFLPLAAIFFSTKSNMMFTVKNVSQYLFKLLRLQSFDYDAAQFVKKIVRELVDHRKKNGVKGKDIVQGIIEVMDEYGPKDGNSADGKVEYFPDGSRIPKFDFDEMFLHAFIFFLGGIESTASVMTWLFYELAVNMEVQDKCREEIRSVAKAKGRHVSLEDIDELPYLNGTIKEAIRLYPAFMMMSRKCTKPHYFEECDFTVQPGQLILIPTQAIQRDPKYFEDPDTINPERVDDNRTGLITSFGLGPKMCIGKTFAISEMILVVSRLLHRYKFSINQKTVLPLTPSKGRPINTPSTPLWMNITRVD